ncbi:MAG: permease [Anaerolineales bacterium]|nr:permease [Anaerolineales bacterium]
MDATTLILSAVAAALLVFAFWRGRDLPLAGISAGGSNLWRNLPILLLGFVIAGLVQVLVPKELISRWIGAQAGAKGVLVACVAGGLVPGSPYAVFPLMAGLQQAGAGLGAVVGFVSAWSLWSVSRLPVEIALIDPKAALVRYGLTFVVPPIAGLLANALSRLL